MEGLKIVILNTIRITIVSDEKINFITIQNTFGETIKNITVLSGEISVDISNLPSGVYFVSDDLGNSSKIIVSK